MTDDKRPLKVFLCHASADKPMVRELYRYLKRRGLQPWLDEIDLLPGHDWDLEIYKATRDTDAIIICLSKESVAKEGYVQKEIRRALDISEEKPDGTIYVIPLRLEECDVPFRLKKYQWVDLFAKEGREKLLKSLNMRANELGCNVIKTSDVSKKPKLPSEQSKKESHSNDSDLANAIQKQKVQSSLSSEIIPNSPQPEIIFHTRYCSRVLILEGATPEQVINYIRDNISAGFWFNHLDNKIAYDVDSTRTQFFDPQKDNTIVHGIIFHGIKHDLEQREGGILIRHEIQKIPNMFTMSVIPAGIGDKVKLRVKFDTDFPEVTYFFDIAEKELQKMFTVVEPPEKLIAPPVIPQKPPRKLKTEYIVAIIGAVAIILAAVIGILPQVIKITPTTTMPSVLSATSPFTQPSTPTYVILSSSKTPEIDAIPIDTRTTTVTFTPTPTLTVTANFMSPTLTQKTNFCSWTQTGGLVTDGAWLEKYECTCVAAQCTCRYYSQNKPGGSFIYRETRNIPKSNTKCR
jgi:hypothetical protein